MSKEQRDAEIERILDLSVAQENSRLEQGGAGIGDRLEGVEYEGRRYGVAPRELVPTQQVQRYLEPEPDDYRGLIEAEPQAPQLTATDFQADTERRLDEIRGRVMSYDQHIREDMGFLLTVIDASR